ncbi:MAG: MBL fold metallo-hydrolase [Actinomycetota bacterium]
MTPDISFRWLGTAGFRVEHGGEVFLIDPFLSRNAESRPVLDLSPADLSDARYIFISHGHFDHLADVPEIAGLSGARVFCSSVAAATLHKKGVPSNQVTVLSGQERTVLDGMEVSTTPTPHIRFDLPLVARTLPRALRELPRLLPEVRGWPAGPVLVFTFDFDGFRVVHAGSLGLKAGDPLVSDIRGADIFIPTLQGHSYICRRAAELTADVRPRAVVPQHHDDFYPPISRTVNLEPFRAMVRQLLPDCAFYEPHMNVEFTAADALAGDSR